MTEYHNQRLHNRKMGPPADAARWQRYAELAYRMKQRLDSGALPVPARTIATVTRHKYAKHELDADSTSQDTNCTDTTTQ